MCDFVIVKFQFVWEVDVVFFVLFVIDFYVFGVENVFLVGQGSCNVEVVIYEVVGIVCRCMYVEFVFQ